MGVLIIIGIFLVCFFLSAAGSVAKVFAEATPVINSVIVAFTAFALCKWKIELKTAWCVVIAAAVGYGIFYLHSFKTFFWIFAVLFTLAYGFLLYTIVYLFEAPEEYRIIAPGIAILFSVIGHKNWYEELGMYIKPKPASTDAIIDIDAENTD